MPNGTKASDTASIVISTDAATVTGLKGSSAQVDCATGVATFPDFSMIAFNNLTLYAVQLNFELTFTSERTAFCGNLRLASAVNGRWKCMTIACDPTHNCCHGTQSGLHFDHGPGPD